MPFQSKVVACACAAILAAGCQHFTSAPLEPAKSAHDFTGRALDDPGLRAFIETVEGPQTEWPLKTWDFPHLTLAAFYFQPSLEVWRAQWRSAQAAQRTAAGRRNPVVTLLPGLSANAPIGASPWIPLATVDIPIETAGKRGLRKLHSAQLAAASQLAVQSAAWQVRSALRTSLLDFALNQRRAELLEGQLQFQAQTVEILEQRFAAGAVSPFEVTAARTARLRTEADLADARLKLTGARAQLAQIIGVPLNAIEHIQITPVQLDSADQIASLLASAARDRALQSRSDIQAALLEYAASETALRLEIARQYPDIHLQPGYQFDEGEHKWTLGLSFELPLLNRNEGPIAEAEARRKEAAVRFLALQAQVIGAIEQAGSEFNALRAQQVRARNLLDLQRQQRAATEAAFQAGSADRLELTSANFEAAIAELTAADLESRELGALGRLEDALQQDPAATRAVEKSATKNFAEKSK